jgi:hypothetical protein
MALAAGEGGRQGHTGPPRQGQIVRPPRDGDRTWVSYRTDVDGDAGGYWIAYSAEKGEWEAKA